MGGRIRWGAWLAGVGLLAGQAVGEVVSVEAAARFNQPQQITTNPGEDFAPSVSPNGKTLVYVSDQSGNLDLWLKHLGRGLQAPDKRLTFHSGEDNSPAISPDSKWLAFVSNRTDPKGDIYLVPLDLDTDEGRTAAKEKDDAAKALTDAVFPDADPVWSPDQKRLFFTSADPETGQPFIFRMDMEGRQRERVSKISAVNPALSPDGTLLVMVARGDKAGLWVQNLKSGQLVQLTSGETLDLSPRVSPDARRIYFSRYQDDTNQDGRVSIDDQPNLWSVGFDGIQPGNLRQLTDSSTYDLQPVPVGDRVYFTSTTRTGTDVWNLDPDGLLPKSDKFGHELQTVEDLCADYGEQVYRCLLADNALVNDFSGDQALARILYRQARGYQALGQLERAREIYHRIVKNYAQNARYRGLSQIKLLLIEVTLSRQAGKAAYREKNREVFEQLGALIQDNPNQPAVAARAWLEQGHALFELEDFPGALKHYKHVVQTYPAQRHLSAEAAFSQSKVYQSVGDQKSVISAFVQVVRDYYDVQKWTRRAIAEILEAHEHQPTLSKKISSLQNLAEQYKELPLLAAAIQNRVGELYYQAGENLLAKEAYKKTVDRYADAPGERNKARFALAAIFSEEENYEMSLAQYQAIGEESGNLPAALEDARQGYIRKSIEKGEWELRVGEIKLARKTFLKLIEFEPKTVEAHRGYTQAEAALKRTAEAVQFYQERVKGDDPTPEDQYALGLAYTYFDPPQLDKAQKWIQSALVQNANVVFYHQTMGWVFEQREHQQPDGDFLERAVQEYQTALVLNDPEADPGNEANLMLNLGNGHFMLNNFFTSYLFYDQRDASGRDFLDAQRAALFYQRFGESAFKTGRPDRAVEQFKKSLALVAKMDQPGRLAELNDRIALAYQDDGQYAQAVEYFSKTLALHQQTGNTVSMARTLRNIANNLYSLNENKADRDSSALNRALSHYFDAIEKLESAGVVQRAKVTKSSGGGLMDVSVQAGVDDASSQAALGFDKSGERKLIFHYVGKIFGDFGDYNQAIAYFQKKLDLIPKDLDPKQHLPLLLEKALLLNQIGHFHYQAGHLEQCQPFFRDSYAISRQIANRQGIGVNASNLGRVLILQLRNAPSALLLREMEKTITLLEEAAGLLDADTSTLPNPEFRVYVKNDLGLLYHFLAWHGAEAPANPGRQEAVGAVTTALQHLDTVSRNVSRSITYLKEALEAAQVLEGPARERMVAALRQNLKLAHYLAGNPDKTQAQQTPSADPPNLLFTQWQLKFLESLQAQGDDRLALLYEGDVALLRLPFGYPRGPAYLPMMEELYRQLTQTLFDQGQFGESLHFAEMNVRQALLARLGETDLVFRNETRQTLFEEISKFTRDLQALAKTKDPDPEAVQAEADALMQEYDEFLNGVVAEEDPGLVWLVSSRAPEAQEVQDLLRPGSVLLRYEWLGDRILVWWLNGETIHGGQIPVDAALRTRIERLSQEGATASTEDLTVLSAALLAPVEPALKNGQFLVLIAGGPLEFLPWAALPLEGQPLIQRLSIAYQASLTQFVLAERGKNLYNSRLLAVELPQESFDGLGARFASAENLVQHDGNVERFSDRYRHFGVVAVDSPAFLAGLDLGRTYISLTRRVHHYERLDLKRLLEQEVESNFIALNEVDYRFSPESPISPTAPLLHTLTFAGYPGILLHRGPVDPKLHTVFLSRFFETFRRGNPAESLRLAQAALAEQFPQTTAWADYRFYGFPGMTEEEKNEFAQGRYQENVQAGAQAFQDARWLAAINRFEKALVLIDFLEDPSQATQLNKLLAQSAYNLGDYNKGIHYQKQVLALAEQAQDPEQVAEAHYFLGILYSRSEDFPASVEHLKQALKFYEEYEILDKLAESYSTLGIVEENALDYDGALQAFEASIKLHEEMGEDLNRGRELRRIGRIYLLRLNHYPKAEEYFTAANDLFQKLDVPEQTAESWLEMGQVAEKQSRFEDAMALYQKAQALSEKQELKLQLSKAFLFQGNTQWFQGNYQDAFRYQKQALAIAEEIDHKHQQVLIYNTLGLIYWTLNDSKRALANLETSRKMAESILAYLDVASAYNNMGLVYRKDKEYEKSIELFDEALKRDEELKSKWGQGYTHRNLGISYLRLKQLDRAEEHIQKAIALSTEIGNNTNLVKAKLELGNLALERKQCEPAIGIFQETTQLARRYNIKEVLWRALRGQGACLDQLKRLPEAIAVYKQAVDVVDGMRAAIKVEEFQNGFLTDKQDVYKELILLLLESGKVQESFEYAERAKSRSFIDLLGNQKISLKDDVSQKFYDRLVAQKQTIREIEERLSNTEGEEAVQQVQLELVQARNGYQDMLIEVKEQSPQVSNFITVDSITLGKLQGMLNDDVALVEYLVAENELVAWVISKSKIDVVRTPMNEPDLVALIKDYRNRMQHLAPLEDQSRKLYDLVVRPVEPHLAGKRVVGIVPHSHLHYLSFSSLNDGEAYLVERHPLFFSPSASVLEYTFGRKQEHTGPVKVLAMGNPDLGTLNYDLPLAEMEANAIRWDFPAVTVLTRENASESWLQKHISEFQVIHIASHGEFDPVNPLFSSLKLARDDQADGNFEVNEVFALNIQADLVTLSACQTGLGEITGGDELVGLNRAFIYAGTHAIVSSLWRVSDISTAVLIKHFYRNYTKENKGESLRKAQLQVKRLYPHPSYWAGFILTGDYR